MAAMGAAPEMEALKIWRNIFYKFTYICQLSVDAGLQ
jgi:hypothetical protein